MVLCSINIMVKLKTAFYAIVVIASRRKPQSLAGTAHLTKHNLKFCQDMISSKNISTHRIKHAYFVKIVQAHFTHIVQIYLM